MTMMVGRRQPDCLSTSDGVVVDLTADEDHATGAKVV